MNNKVEWSDNDMDINSHSSEFYMKLCNSGVLWSPAYSSIFLLSVCMNPASLQSFLLTTFFSSFFILWSIRTFLGYYCDDTYDSSSWSARKDYPCAMQTQNKNQSCLKRFQCQVRCEQRSRYKVIACRQMNGMKS